ncbi:ABC transporter permease [Phytoactinopolyspora limicola]|uniref:ABC transporter permease n=1 Tax=Phytoactinopolyspora limicola TaxID=2715536 RepID=UPI0014091E01|nr:ABC transporter permease [Phytoactinopolyspora limicola]
MRRAVRRVLFPAAGGGQLLAPARRRRPWAVYVGGVLLGLVVLLALFPHWIAPHDPAAQDLTAQLLSPSLTHPFGTDDFGRDILSRVVHGTRISLVIAVVTVAVAVVLGAAVGTIAGMRGGWTDEILMRATDVFMAFPSILLPMVVVVALGPSLTNTTVALIVVWWAPYARMIRGQVLSVKENAYVDSARMIDAGWWRIVRRYIWPNALPPFVALATVDVGFVILTAAGLGFLGLGAQPPTPEWGLMIGDGLSSLLRAWWPTVFPGLAISVAVLAFNLLGDALQDRLGGRR